MDSRRSLGFRSKSGDFLASQGSPPAYSRPRENLEPQVNQIVAQLKGYNDRIEHPNKGSKDNQDKNQYTIAEQFFELVSDVPAVTLPVPDSARVDSPIQMLRFQIGSMLKFCEQHRKNRADIVVRHAENFRVLFELMSDFFKEYEAMMKLMVQLTGRFGGKVAENSILLKKTKMTGGMQELPIRMNEIATALAMGREEMACDLGMGMGREGDLSMNWLERANTHRSG